jgi:hypothetical protein
MERGTVCLFLVVFFLLGFVAPSDATITFIESRKTFHTKPDQHLGQPLLGGYDYMGRLQVVRENPTLCPGRYPDQAFDIVTPSDGIPGELSSMSHFGLLLCLFTTGCLRREFLIEILCCFPFHLRLIPYNLI